MRSATPHHTSEKSKEAMKEATKTKPIKKARVVSPPPCSPSPSPRSSPVPKGRSIRRPSDKDGQRLDWSDAIGLALLGASILFSGDNDKGKGTTHHRRGSSHYHGSYDRDYDYGRRSMSGSSYGSSPYGGSSYGGSRRGSGGSRRSSTW